MWGEGGGWLVHIERTVSLEAGKGRNVISPLTPRADEERMRRDGGRGSGMSRGGAENKTQMEKRCFRVNKKKIILFSTPSALLYETKRSDSHHNGRMNHSYN